MNERQGIDQAAEEVVMVRKNGVVVWIGGDEDA